MNELQLATEKLTLKIFKKKKKMVKMLLVQLIQISHSLTIELQKKKKNTEKLVKNKAIYG